jgi:transforming growth factor-beta-induced protein
MRKVFSIVATAILFTAVTTLSSCKKEEEKQKTIVEIAQGDSNFSILVQALTRSDLSTNYATVLSGTGPFTVFAPTNAAFSALLTELGASSLNDIPPATLEAVLKYHVVTAKVLSSSLTEGQEVTTFLGEKFKVSLAGGAKITDAKGRVANITTVDLQGSNGVIHVIDKVLLP